MEHRESALRDIREELHGLARDEGLAPGKLESSRILKLMSRSSELSGGVASEVLVKLIVELVADLHDEKERAAARATLNVGSRGAERTATARQVALAQQRRTHPDTVRRWWRRAATELAASLLDRIDEFNRSPSTWAAYLRAAANSTVRVSDTLPNYYFDQVDMIWRIRGRRATELITFRRLVAREDGVDRVKARGWYFSDQGPDACEIVPLINCTMAYAGHVGRGMQVAELVFAEPLRQGEQVFYGYRVVVHSDKDLETLFYHHVTSAGVRRLHFHIQYDLAEMPASVWKFASSDDAEPMIPPEAGSAAYLDPPNATGYLGADFSDAPHGIKCGISWNWQDR